LDVRVLVLAENRDFLIHHDIVSVLIPLLNKDWSHTPNESKQQQQQQQEEKKPSTSTKSTKKKTEITTGWLDEEDEKQDEKEEEKEDGMSREEMNECVIDALCACVQHHTTGVQQLIKQWEITFMAWKEQNTQKQASEEKDDGKDEEEEEDEQGDGSVFVCFCDMVKRLIDNDG
jgi:hypothetical protein